MLCCTKGNVVGVTDGRPLALQVTAEQSKCRSQASGRWLMCWNLDAHMHYTADLGVNLAAHMHCNAEHGVILAAPVCCTADQSRLPLSCAAPL